jgi:hypothetical protein
VTRPLVANDFAVIRARMEELRHEGAHSIADESSSTIMPGSPAPPRLPVGPYLRWLIEQRREARRLKSST